MRLKKKKKKKAHLFPLNDLPLINGISKAYPEMYKLASRKGSILQI